MKDETALIQLIYDYNQLTLSTSIVIHRILAIDIRMYLIAQQTFNPSKKVVVSKMQFHRRVAMLNCHSIMLLNHQFRYLVIQLFQHWFDFILTLIIDTPQPYLIILTNLWFLLLISKSHFRIQRNSYFVLLSIWYQYLLSIALSILCMIPHYPKYKINIFKVGIQILSYLNLNVGHMSTWKLFLK